MGAFNPLRIAPTEHSRWLRSLSEHNQHPLVGFNFISGAVPSNAADATNDVSFTAGACVSNSGNLFPIAATTKQIDATFARGSGVGGLAAGLSVTNTTYHAFALFGPKTKNQDVGFDTSITAANLIADSIAVKSGLTEYRRIFSFVRIAGVNQGISAREISGGGLKVDLKIPVNAWSNSTPGTAAVTITLANCPTGVIVNARFGWRITATSGIAVNGLTTPLATTDTLPSTIVNNASGALDLNGLIVVGSEQAVDTNTSAQIRYRLDVSAENIGTLMGWIDDRI